MQLFSKFWKNTKCSWVLLTLLILLFLPISTNAQVTFYSLRADFNTANPNLPTEGFESANMSGQPYLVEGNPVSSATNDSIFSAGSILPNLTVSNLNPLNTPGLIIYGDGAVYGASKCVGNNWFGDSLVLSFGTGVYAVGTDVFAATSPGQSLAGDFTEDVYQGTNLLGESNFTETKGEIGFMGASSSSPITSIVLLYTTDDATTFADNIAFGNPQAVPAPSGFLIAGLGCLVLLFSKTFSKS